MCVCVFIETKMNGTRDTELVCLLLVIDREIFPGGWMDGEMDRCMDG